MIRETHSSGLQEYQDSLKSIPHRYSSISKLLREEKKNKMTIDIITDNTLIIPEYTINIQNKSKKTIELIEHHEKLKNLEQQKMENKNSNIKVKKFTKKKIYKKKFYKKTK